MVVFFHGFGKCVVARSLALFGGAACGDIPRRGGGVVVAGSRRGVHLPVRIVCNPLIISCNMGIRGRTSENSDVCFKRFCPAGLPVCVPQLPVSLAKLRKIFN